MTAAPIPPRPRCRSRQPHPGEQLGQPGTILRLPPGHPDGHAIVYANLELGDDEARVRQLAQELLRTPLVTVVGDPVRAAWCVRRLMADEWAAARRALREAWAAAHPKPEPEPRKPRERCGAPRRGGAPCRAWAGSGTGTSEGPCISHGGDRSALEAQMETAAEAAVTLVRTWSTARTRPLTPVEELAQLTAMRAVMTFAGQRRRRRR